MTEQDDRFDTAWNHVEDRIARLIESLEDSDPRWAHAEATPLV
ncbi:MAG: hypothetical protein ACOYEV_06055 [Candidatus Nanopelagicales bacterium]